jgi:hypothetical protein
MGNVVASIKTEIQTKIQYCKDNGAEKVFKEVIDNICQRRKAAYDSINEFLDFMSVNACLEKPTLHLVTICLNMPVPDRDIIQALLTNLWRLVSLITIPAKLLSDKKFCTHAYETSFIFQNNVGQVNPHNSVTLCEKVLIYLASKSHRVKEPRRDQMVQGITIDNNDYDIPVNLWYTLDMKNSRKIYFYVYISVSTGYKGILLAANKDDTDLFVLIKEKVIKHYTKTLGRHVGTGRVIADILDNDDGDT